MDGPAMRVLWGLATALAVLGGLYVLAVFDGYHRAILAGLAFLIAQEVGRS